MCENSEEKASLDMSRTLIPSVLSLQANVLRDVKLPQRMVERMQPFQFQLGINQDGVCSHSKSALHCSVVD